MRVIFNILLIPMALLLSCHKNDIASQATTLPSYEPPKFPVVNVRDYGAKGDGIADDNKAIQAAMDSAYLKKLPLYFPSGTYLARITLNYDSIQIIGDKFTGRFFDKTGTVILGIINCNAKKGVSIKNLNIDSRNLVFTNTYNDATLSSGLFPGKETLNQEFSNIAIIGNGYNDYKHGILCQAGNGIKMDNIFIADFYHGIAVRCSNVSIDGVSTEYCGFTSIVIKSANYNELVENVSVKNVNIKGDPSNIFRRGGVVLINSYDSSSLTRNISIDSVRSAYGSVGAVNVEQTAGVVSDVNISNCYAEYCGDSNIRAAFDVNGGRNITYTNCKTVNCSGTGYRSSGNPVNLKVVNSFEINSSVVPYSGVFKYFQLNGVEIIK